MKLTANFAFRGLASLLVLFQITAWAQTSSAPPGSGSIADPWEISNPAHLLWIAEETAAGNTFAGEYLVQIDNIDATVTASWFPDGSGGFAGFSPIGLTNTQAFAGDYDGRGHAIQGLFINRPSQTRVALFGTVAADGRIRNLGLTDLDFTGDAISGGLVGINRGEIERVFTNGNLSASATLGGLVATNSSGAVIRDAYSLVNVDGGFRAGGLVGHNFSLIENVFAAGDVVDTTGNWPASFGGLVGENAEPNALVINGFWNIDASSFGDADDGAGDQTGAQSGIVGLNTAGMQTLSSFDGLWAIEGRANLPAGYPVLQWQIDQDFSPEAPIWLIQSQPEAAAVPFASPLILGLFALLLLVLGGRRLIRQQR